MRLRRLLAAAIACAAASAAAQDRGWYAGAALGQSTFKEFCSSSALSCDEKDTAWKLFGGYRFNPYFAVEGTYLDWGEASGTINTASGVRTIPLGQTGMGIAAVGSLPIRPQFSLFGKVGYVWTTQETPASASGNFEREEEELHYGLGVRLAFTPNWGARAEWERADKTKVELFSIGLEYRF